MCREFVLHVFDLFLLCDEDCLVCMLHVCIECHVCIVCMFALNVRLKEIFISFYEFVPAAQSAALVSHSS